MPDSILIIDNHAFRACYSLREINFGKGLREIKHVAFQDCRQLKRLVFKSPDVLIDPTAFDGCDSIETVSIPLGTSEYYSEQVAFQGKKISFVEH